MVQTEKGRLEAGTPRLEILAAASEVFRKKGFHRAGMRDIAAALGVAVGKLYYYFRSKQDLLAFCQQDTLRRLLRTQELLEGLGLPPDRRLDLLVRGHLRCLNRGIPGSLAHLEVEGLEAPLRRPIVVLRDRYERRLRELIAEGSREGVFRDADPKLTALAMLGALNWTVKWYRPGGNGSLEVIEDSFAEQIVRGLLAPGRRYRPPGAAGLGALAETEDGI